MKNNYIGPKKLAKLQASQKEYQNKIKALHERGFRVFACQYNGKKPMTWTFSHNGESSALGWDNESQVIEYLLKIV